MFLNNVVRSFGFLKRTYASRQYDEATQLLLEAKKKSGLSFEQLGKSIGRSEVWVASLIYNEACADQEEAEKLVDTLQIKDESARQALVESLTEIPLRAIADQPIPQDPFIYRLYEVAQAHGLPLKAVVNEKIGDGILSAIDMRLEVNKKEEDGNTRVEIVIDGKFLPYRKY
mmetsp:Transcript_1832/g.2636  ORF Transcript_1832/g.2636 Transcript_1832/m.2636 type:complete len:172 (+) Transcript_1832:43-558(+)